MEQRATIKFCVKPEKKFAETYELMIKVYGDDCMSRTQIYTWFTRFKNGRDDLNEDPRPGSVKCTTSQDQKSQRIFDEKTDLCHGLPSVFAWSIAV